MVRVARSVDVNRCENCVTLSRRRRRNRSELRLRAGGGRRGDESVELAQFALEGVDGGRIARDGRAGDADGPTGTARGVVKYSACAVSYPVELKTT